MTFDDAWRKFVAEDNLSVVWPGSSAFADAVVNHREQGARSIAEAVDAATHAKLDALLARTIVAAQPAALAAPDPLWHLDQLITVVGWQSRQTAFNYKLPPEAKENDYTLPVSRWKTWLADVSRRAHGKLARYLISP